MRSRKRRHLQIHDIDAIEQILAESAVFDFRFQLAVGGADHAHFHFLVFLGADAAELAVLQQLQQLGLQAQVELGDFVEKEGAAMGHFHAPRLRSVGAGEGAFFVSEEFAFQQRAGDRRTIDFDERTAPPRRKPVDHTGDDVFAGAAFALNQNRNVGAGDFVQAVAQRLHDLRATEYDRFGRKLSQ